jgi:hypothetical protein
VNREKFSTVAEWAMMVLFLGLVPWMFLKLLHPGLLAWLVFMAVMGRVSQANFGLENVSEEDGKEVKP